MKRRGNNEGSITKRKDGRYQGYIRTGRKVNGKPEKQYYYGKSKKEVQEQIQEAKAQIYSGTFANPGKITVGEWLENWLKNYKKTSIRSTTFERYQNIIEKHIKPAIGHIKLSQLQTSHIQNLLNNKSKDNRTNHKEGSLSPRSIRLLHQVLSAALRQACKPGEGLLRINPAQDCILPRDPNKRIEIPSNEEIQTFINEVKDSRHYPLYILELATGLRRGEIIALKWGDLDLEEGILTVQRNLVRTTEGPIFQEPKSNYGIRIINLPRNVCRVLKKHKNKINQEKLLMGPAYRDGGFVFCREDGQFYHPRAITKHLEAIVERLLEEGAIENKFTFHTLRHLYGTSAINAGIPVKTVQENLGHHDPGFTMKAYCHNTEEKKKEAADKIGDLLTSLCDVAGD